LGSRLIAEATINEKELNAFIKAYVDYQKIRANYGHALERATDSQDKSGSSRKLTRG